MRLSSLGGVDGRGGKVATHPQFPRGPRLEKKTSLGHCISSLGSIKYLED